MRYLIAVLLSLCLTEGICWASASQTFTGGATDYIDTGQDAPFDGLSALTIAIWNRRTGDSSGCWDRSMSKGLTGGTDGTYGTFISGSGTLNQPYGEAIVGGVKENVNDTTVPAVNTWYHTAMTWGSNVLTLYVNGASVSTNATSGSINTNTRSFIISAETTGNCGFPGQLAYAHVYNRALTVVEINEIRWHPGSIVDGLILYYPMNEPDGATTFIDLGPNKYDGTETGTIDGSAEGPPIFLTSPTAAWKHLWTLVSDWFLSPVWADDLITCNPSASVPNQVSSYQRSTDPFKSGAMADTNTMIFSNPTSTVRPWDGVAPPGNPIYWKCVDTNGDAVMDDVIEMSSAEKSTIDAPTLLEQARQNAFNSEITTNDLCTAELTDIISRIETRRTTLRDAIESQRVTNNTTISGASNNIAGVKSAMTTVNNVTAAEFGQSVDELASLATKIAKCVRARAH